MLEVFIVEVNKHGEAENKPFQTPEANALIKNLTFPNRRTIAFFVFLLVTSAVVVSTWKTEMSQLHIGYGPNESHRDHDNREKTE